MLVPKILLLTLLSVQLANCNNTTQKLNTSSQRITLTNSTKAPEAIGGISGATEASTTEVPTTEAPTSTVGTCENNDTECISVTVTTISSIDNDTGRNETAKEKNKKKQRSKIQTDANICTCNLQVDYCDINCCCDPDCSPSDKAIFGYCQMDENRYYDTRYCNYVKYIYVNNTPFQWEVNQDGLFCVISSNLPETYLIQKEEPIKSIETVRLEKNFWSQENDNFLEKEFHFGLRNYVFGDSIKIIRDDLSIDNFRLPRNFITSPCIFEEDVYYLKDEKTICSQIMIDDNVKLNFATYFKSFKIIGAPKLFNISKLKNNYKNCPKNICLHVEPKLCDIHFTNCSDFKENSNVTLQCSYDLKRNLNTCRHAVEKVLYKFHHNGTDGLLKVEVLAVLRNFSYHFGQRDVEFFQEFAVEFVWINQIKNYSQILSGNPGYVTGKPVLVGVETSKGNTSFIEKKSPSFVENFLVFPADAAGECVRNDTFNVPVEFEYNMIAKCELRRELTLQKTGNATDICRNIQETIFDLWGLGREANNKSLVLGLFGNANASNLQDWTPILYKTKPTDFLNSTRGIFTNKNQTLVCQNISALLNIDIFYSRVDLKTILNQHKVLGGIFSFLNVRNYSFSIRKNHTSSSIGLSLGLVNQVSFYDITGDKARKFVDPPSFDIRLPYDFFYPFIRVGNGCISLVKPNVVVTLLFLYWNCLF